MLIMCILFFHEFPQTQCIPPFISNVDRNCELDSDLDGIPDSMVNNSMSFV